MEQKFGARRCRDTRKPLAKQCPEVAFYRCEECNALYVVTGGDTVEGKQITCCEKQTKMLTPVTLEFAQDRIEINYQITGGYNDNAVRVSWNVKGETNKPDWIYLKTFTGGYLNYIMEAKRSPLVFALADTDAFAYCDEDPCLECVFRCKRGFVIYVYASQVGLIEIPLDRMNAHWQSEKKESRALDC